MEREQIIKALECCTRSNNVEYIPCPDCPYNEYNRLDGTTERHKSKCCDWWLMVDALALIKELTEDNEAQAETITNLIETIKTLKADIVREFAERLKKEIRLLFNNDEFLCRSECNIIDQTAKEILNNTED